MSCNNLPIKQNDFFNWKSPEYDNEKALFASSISEIINSFGVRVDYYTVSISSSNNPLFGEDNNRTINNKFRTMVYFELPDENRNSALTGIVDTDIVKAYIGKAPFSKSALKTGIVYEKPKRGDLIKTFYKDIWYEVVDVKDTEMQFQQTQHVWSLTCRVYVNNQLSQNQSTSGSMPETSQIVDKADLFDQTTSIDDAKQGVIISGGNSKNTSNSIFGSW